MRPSTHPNTAISSALLRMRCQSGCGSATPLLKLENASAGVYSTAPATAPAAAPMSSIASPMTAPDAAPSAAPQIRASARRPDRLRLRRSVAMWHGATLHAVLLLHLFDSSSGDSACERTARRCRAE